LTGTPAFPYSLRTMRWITCGIMLAFLWTSTHVLVDHGDGGHQSFVLLPHLGPTHIPHEKEHPSTSHDHEEEPYSTQDTSHHQADTHSHFAWYAPTDAKITRYCAPGTLDACMGLSPAVAGASALRGPTVPPPPRGHPVYLRCSVLRI
jgi:hypothetical protein